MKRKRKEKERTAPKWWTAAHVAFFYSLNAFVFSDIATIVNILAALFWLFKSYTCGMLKNFISSASFFCSVHLAARYILFLFILCLSFRLILFFFFCSVVVFVCIPFPSYLFFIIWLESLSWKRDVKRIKSAEALNLKQSCRFCFGSSVMLIFLRPVHRPRSIQITRSDEIEREREYCWLSLRVCEIRCGAGHRLSRSYIIDPHTHTHKRRSNKISLEQKLLEYYVNMHQTDWEWSVCLCFVLMLNAQIGFCPHIWRIHFWVPCCLCVLQHASPWFTISWSDDEKGNSIHSMAQWKQRWFISDKRS